MRAQNLMLTGVMLSAVVGLACSGGESVDIPPGPDASGTRKPGGFTATFAEAEDLLGFELIFPEYVPAGLTAPRSTMVYVREGRSSTADLGYVLSTAECVPPGIVELMLLTEEPPSYIFAFGEEMEIADVRVHFSEQGTLFSAAWNQNDRRLDLAIFACEDADIDTAVLRDEAVKVIESMVLGADDAARDGDLDESP